MPVAGRQQAGRSGDSALRVFVALVLPPEVQVGLARQCAAWRTAAALRGGRFAREFHVTLQFLGDVPKGRADSLCGALADAYAGVRVFHVSGGSLGAFPSAERASVLWWGVDDGAAALCGVASLTAAALEPLGFARESRRFVPHVTLARFREPAGLADWLAAERCSGGGRHEAVFAPFLATELCLMSSELRPDGARYEAVARFPLATAA